MDFELKPKRSPEELVELMKQKGITFENVTEADAANYLRYNNNYYRLASYRKNYDKNIKGDNKGKYIDLDFSYLTELSTIDMHLRFLIVKMCLDIEHAMKVQTLAHIADNEDEDGYDIVKSFIMQNPYIEQEICNKQTATYVGELIKKNFEFETVTDENGNTITKIKEIKCPVWALMEIIGFGDFIRFYRYYSSSTTYNVIQEGALNLVKSLRNACAHNNCIINNLRGGTSFPPSYLSRFVSTILSISKGVRNGMLSKRPILEMTALMYVYDQVVVDTVKSHRFAELKELFENRMERHSDYFKNQQIISSTYWFFRKIVDFLI